MFIKTYGQLYEQNADIFIDLFMNLRFDYEADRHRYRGNTDTVAETDGDVRGSLDRFFVVLLRRMLPLLIHPRAKATDQFLYCVSSRIDQLKPFGDVPSKLSIQLHRSFIAARAFIVGLKTGSDAMTALSKVRQSVFLSETEPFLCFPQGGPKIPAYFDTVTYLVAVVKRR